MSQLTRDQTGSQVRWKNASDRLFIDKNIKLRREEGGGKQPLLILI